MVLAAGLSSRMGAFKPLLPLDGRTVVETAIAALADAGVPRIVVVTGHRADELAPAIARAGATAAHNPDFRDGMYSSVRTGVAALTPHDIDGFFLLPCDIPRVGAATVRLLAAARAEVIAGGAGARGGPPRGGSPPPVVYPVHGRRRGHPPLIDAGLIPAILEGAPDDGLRGLLAAHAERALHVPTADPAVLQDLDTDAAYRRMLATGGGEG